MIRPPHCVMRDSSSGSTAIGSCPSEELRPGARLPPLTSKPSARHVIVRQVKRSTLYNKLAAALAAIFLTAVPSVAAPPWPGPLETGIIPIRSTAAEGSHIFCDSPCKVWSFYVTSGASAGNIMTFNATTVPADGAVQPFDCIPLEANNIKSASMGGDPPDEYTVGFVAVFSVGANCFTKTESATTFMKARISK